MFYFAYGATINKKYMAERCPEAKARYIAALPNYKLMFTNWSRQWKGGTATIKRFTGGRVPGALYEVSEQCLRQLDRIEEGAQRVKVLVFGEVGETPIEAITYARTGQITEAEPSMEYIRLMKQGYNEWGVE